MQRTRRVQRSEFRAYFGSQQSVVINTSSNSEKNIVAVKRTDCRKLYVFIRSLYGKFLTFN